MKDEYKTKQQLVKELSEFRNRLNKIQASECKIRCVVEGLEQSEKKYRELSNLLPQTIFEIDKEGNITFTNQSGFQTFGYTQEDFDKGLNAFQMFIQEDRERVREDIQRVLSGELLGGVEFTALRKDSSTFPVIIFSSPIIVNNTPVGLRGIVIDTTEQKRAKEELKRSEEKYRLVVENANEIIVIAQDGFVKWANPKTAEISGYSESELMNKPFVEFIHPDDRKMVYENYLKRINGKKAPEMYSFRIVDHSGKVKWLLHNAIITTWENRPATLNFLIDVTGHKKAEDDLYEREKQLYKSQKMEAIGRLTGGIAHDFNNILTAVIGFSDFLLMKLNENDFSYRYIHEIKKAGERASSLIHQLLAFSRKQILKPKILNINTMVSDMEKILKRLIGEDIHLVLKLDPKLGNAKLDQSQVEQVIMNLAVNARDAMFYGGNLILETANVHINEEYSNNHISMKSGPYVMISVSDNGTGMEKEVKEHIFEPFFTTKKDGKGTGLGLSTVYGIVKQSDGYIWVYSEPKYGTTFKIYFPGVLQEVKPDRFHKISKMSLFGNETILLVEDEEFVRDMISSVLKTYGYRVIEATNGEEALRHCNKSGKEAIDLLITDVIMPKMSGCELADKLIKKISDLKVLFISGYTEDAIVHHGILEDGIPFLPKPFTINELGEKVREVLNSNTIRSYA